VSDSSTSTESISICMSPTAIYRWTGWRPDLLRRADQVFERWVRRFARPWVSAPISRGLATETTTATAGSISSSPPSTARAL
jgi:hypothetical protein